MVELILTPTMEVIQGVVYTTDEISRSVVLQKSLVHTTLASEIRIIHESSIQSSKIVSNNDTNASSNGMFQHPLPNINRKALEEREKRALRLAEESFRHINQKVRVVQRNPFSSYILSVDMRSLKSKNTRFVNFAKPDILYLKLKKNEQTNTGFS
jgi:hypothetical protein